ncbi:hypothetical protein Tco_0704303 [Tanacetum coccineum]|uniref:Uncharacterized protein n=1 Tax=Tanacetum coccineum TaxID=301880 RepID=A0ABQ4Y250_9ASTR
MKEREKPRPRKGIGKDIQIVKDSLLYYVTQLDKGDVNLQELVNLMKDMVFLLDSAKVFEKAKAEGEKVSLKEDMEIKFAEEANVVEEAKAAEKAKANAQGEPQPINTTSKPKNAEEAKFTHSMFKTTSSEFSLSPLRDESKGKGIATKENPLKDLIPLMDEGGSAPKMPNLNQLIIAKERSAQIQAQAQRLAEYEAKRAKMLEEYSHYINHRVDQLPITKISYKINNSTKEAYMRITRNNDPLNLTLNTQAEKLDVPPPPQLTAAGLSVAEKKRKRTSKIIKEVFVSENIVVDGMHRNLVPPLRV